MNLKSSVKTFIEENNLIYGICSAERMDYLEPILKDKVVPFVNYDVEMRINPRLTLDSAKSIIVLGMGYKKSLKVKLDDELRGNISFGAIGTDYHIKLSKYLEELGLVLEKEYENVEYKYFVDNGPLVDREIAKKAGIGCVGKSGNLISKKLGSFFFIGYMITNLKLDFNNIKIEDYSLCNNCNRCILACPGKALCGNGKMNYKNCVSYITQKKGDLTDIESHTIKNSIYGCDICQLVCPYNKNVISEDIEELDIKHPKLEEFLNLSKKEFNNKYGNSAMAWRGMNTLKRNAIIGVGNSNHKDKFKILEQHLENPSEVIRNVANKYYNQK